MQTSGQGSKSRIWQTCLKLLVCFALLWFVFSRVDLAEVYQLILKVKFEAFTLAFFIYLIAHVLFLFRWHKILRALQVKVRFLTLLRLQLIGLFFNQFLPTSAGGDVIKAYYISQDTGKTGMSFLSVFLDRYIGLLAIIIFAAVAAVVSRLSINDVVIYHWVVLAFVAAVVFTILLASNFGRWVNRLLGVHLKFVQNIIVMINDSSKTIFRNYQVMLWTLLLSLGFMLLVVAINYIFIGYIGKSIELSDLFIFIALIALAASLPISINGAGPRELAYVYFFSTIGFTAEESLSLAVLNLALLLLISLPGALLYLLMAAKKKST